jgi:hypothetical protein
MNSQTKKVALPKSKQTLFNKVATHLLTQKKRSASADGKCAYRLGSLKCAAGCLLPDDFDFKKYNYCCWTALVNWNLVSSGHESLICELQHVHDKGAVKNWPAHLSNLSEKHNLTLPKILKDALKKEIDS